MSKKLDVQAIKRRSDELEKVKEKLKSHFVGIDDVIDKFIESVKIWYILPEVQTRPLIVNLWGLTGVGKTDLIRKFVSYIDFNDRFIEIQMDINDSSYYNNRIQDHIENVLDNANEEGILLLDEMQRFRTVDEKGFEIKNTKYNDLWMLLSDGKFESDSKNRKELFEMMFDILYWEDSRQSEESNDEEEKVVSEGTPMNTEKKNKKKKERKYKTWSYQAKRLKKLLKLENSIEEIMTWGEDEKIEVIQRGLKSKVAFEGNVYSKLLIIISGNLDEAFKMADDVEEVDIDADIFYEYSKKVNLLSIKKALWRRFKPEQIARMGNIHIIYPSLSKSSYYGIIRKKLDTICNLILEKHAIKIIVDNSIHEVIYRNGVFPTQGVRPVLSTISSVFENSLPTFIYHSLLANVDEFAITHNEGYFYSTINGNEIKYQVPRVIEAIKSEKGINEDALCAVHEAGHAVVYALMFKTSPTQIICRTADEDSGGFIGCHNFVYTYEIYQQRMAVNMAGRIAEQLVFGENKVSSGASSDIKHATSLAAYCVRRLAFFGKHSFVTSPGADIQGVLNQDIDGTNSLIDTMVQNATKNAENLLRNNMPFFALVTQELFEKKELKPAEFIEIAKQFVPDIKEIHPKELFIENFHESMQKFIEKK